MVSESCYRDRRWRRKNNDPSRREFASVLERIYGGSRVIALGRTERRSEFDGVLSTERRDAMAMVQVFERYADNHPGQLHLTFEEVVVMALFEALPQKMKGTLLVELSGCALITRSVRAARRSSLSLAVGKSATSADYPTRAERQKK
jgi:hypothetical protein